MVADTWAGLPLHDSTVDAILCIFAPRNLQEFARVLSDDGVLVVVLPQPDHLEELRRSHDLLEVGDAKVEKLVEAARGHLELVSTTPIRHELFLGAQQATDLVAMGPNAFHTTSNIPATRVTVSVTCITMARVN